MLGRPIFTGKTDMDQLKQIFDLVGTPNLRSWEGYTDLKLIRTGEVCIDKEKSSRLREKYGGSSGKIQPATAVSLLEKLLELDPKKRVSASRALHHRYFQTEPLAPKDPSELGTIALGSVGSGAGGGGGGDGGSSSTGYHEFQTKKRRREAKAVARAAGEVSKSRGESVEKQKEAFDRAYRDHLKRGGG
jgi:serine/threonine protein kinase